MIKANELRLGNWVDLLDSKTGHNFVQVTYSLLNAENFIEPIPLTPEIIKKSGLYPNQKLWNLNIVSFHGSWVIETKKSKEIVLIIDYLHQLQNFYFLKTGGEELKINFNEL